jgi:hypothetical protein
MPQKIGWEGMEEGDQRMRVPVVVITLEEMEIMMLRIILCLVVDHSRSVFRGMQVRH